MQSDPAALLERITVRSDRGQYRSPYLLDIKDDYDLYWPYNSVASTIAIALSIEPLGGNSHPNDRK